MIKRLWSYKQTRFIAVGILNTLIDFSILNILVFAFNFNKILANSISVSVAMIVSYLLNKSIVFQQQDKHRVVKITQFIIITAFGLFVLQNGIIYLLVHHFNFFGNLIASLVQAVGLSGLSQNFINLNTAKILATVVTLTWNYFMYRYVVFVKKPKPTG